MKATRKEFQNIMAAIVDKTNYPTEFVYEEIKRLVRNLNNIKFSDFQIVFDLSEEKDIWALINKETIVKVVKGMSKEFQIRVSYIENNNDLEKVVLSLNDSSISFQTSKSYKHDRLQSFEKFFL